jgi:hypothetical protein
MVGLKDYITHVTPNKDLPSSPSPFSQRGEGEQEVLWFLSPSLEATVYTRNSLCLRLRV